MSCQMARAFLLASAFFGDRFRSSFRGFLCYFYRLRFGHILGLLFRGLLVLLIIGHRQSLHRIWYIP